MRDRSFIRLLARRKCSGSVGWALVLLCLVMGTSLSAAVQTWNGLSGTTSNWSDGGNWVGGVAPSTGDDLHFAGSTRTSPVQDFAATTSFASITFDSGAATFTLTAGNSITLTGNITDSSSNNQNIAIPIILNVATSTMSTANTLTMSGIISETGGARALTKTGTGTLIMSAANSYTGTTTISGGTLKVTATSYATPSFSIATGTVLEFNLSSNANYGTTTFSGAGTLRKSGSAAISWQSAAATFQLSSGALIDVVAGTFTGGSFANEVWTSNLSDLTVASGATFASDEANTMVNAINGAGTITSGYPGAGYVKFTYGVDNGSGTFSGVMADELAAANFYKAGTGTQTLTGTNTYTGTTTISAGTLQIGNAGTTGSLSTSSTITNNATLTFNRTNTVTGGTDFKSGISGTGAVTQAGSGTLIFNGTNTYTGATTISAGTLLVNGSTQASSAVAVNSGGTLGGTGTVNGAITTAAGGTMAPGVATGNSIGTLNTAGVTFIGGTYSVDVDGTTPSGDNINSTGTVALGAGVATLTVANATSSTVGKVYTIISAATSVTGTFSGKANGATFTQAGRNFLITYTSTAVTLTDVPSLNTKVWNGGGGTTSWILGANWVGGVAPSAGDDLVFAGSVQTSPTNNYAADTSFSSISFLAGASAFTLAAGNRITLTGNITDSSSNNQNIAIAMILNVAISTMSTANTLTMSGIISETGGARAITKSGAGTLTLSGTNSYSGATTVSAGTFKAGSTSAFGTNSAVTLANVASAILDITGFSNSIGSLAGGGATGGNVTLGAATLTVGGDGTSTSYDGVISGTGALTKSGAGTQTLSRANTYTGTTTINAGTLAIQSTYASASHVIASGAVLELNVVAGTRDYANTTFSGAGTLRKTGVGTAQWSATVATFSLTSGSLIDIVAGTLEGGSFANEVWTSNLSDLTVSSGAIFRGDEANVRVNKINGAGIITTGYPGAGYVKFTLGIDNGTGGDFSGTIIDDQTAGNIEKVGNGAQILSGANTYTGTTTISAGTLQIGNGGTTGSLSTSSTITNNATLTFNRTDTVTGGTDFKSGVGGTGAVTQAGSGTLILIGTNTYTGATTISAGTLQIGNGGTTGSLSTSSTITNNATLTFNRTNNVTQGTDFKNVISGSGAVTQAGSGTIVLTGANTYTGTTTINAGTLAFSGSGNTPNANSIIVNNTGTLRFDRNDTWGNDSTTTSAAITVNAGGTLASNNTFTTLWGLTLNSGAVLLNGGVNATYPAFQFAGTLTVTGTSTVTAGSGSFNIINIGGTGLAALTISTTGSSDNVSIGVPLQTNALTTGALTKSGAGTVILSAANTFTGTTTISAGTLQIGNAGTTGSLSTSSTITNNATLIFNRTDTVTGGTDFKSGIGGTGAVTQAGSGTLIFVGTNTHPGATTVSAGTLLVTGSTHASSAVTVASGATLGGTGTVNGTVAVSAGGTLAPGTGGTTIGNLSTGAVSFSSTGVLSVDLVNATPANEKIITTGTFTCTNGTLTVASTTSPAAGTVYTIVSATAVSGTFSGKGHGSTFVSGGGRTFQIFYTSTAVTVMDVTGVANSTKIWNGLGADNNWTTAANWTGGVAPIPGDTLQFAGSTRVNPCVNDFAAATSFASITFAAGAAIFTLTAGNSITLTGNITDNSSNNQNIAIPMILNVATSTMSTANTLTMSGIISETGGARAITKSGAGTWTLSGANTYTGTTTVSVGTLKTQGAAFWTTARTWSVASGAVLNIDGNTGFASGTTTITGAGTLRMTGGTFANEGPNSPNGFGRNIAMSMSSGGVIDVQSGATMMNGGYQSIVWTGNLADLNVDGTFYLWDGNTVIVDALAGSGAVSSGAYGGVTLSVGADNGSGVFSGILSNANALIKTGSGTQTLSGTNTYTGTTTISAGTLQIGNAGTTGALSSSSAITNNATLTFNRTDAIAGGTHFSNTISGTGAVIQNGIGAVTFSGAASYTGTTTINAGTLILSKVTSYASSTTTVNASGVLELTSTDTVVDNWRVNTILAGAGTINKTGSGWIQTFTNAHTFSGTFNIQVGTFGTSYTTSDWTGITADFNISAGALLDARSQAITVGSLNGAGSVGTTYGFWDAAVNMGAGNKSGTFSGVINGNNTSGTDNSATPNAFVLSLTKTGSGTQTLSGANIYSGATTISAGTLQIGNGGTTGSLSTSSTITNNATLKFNRTDTVTGGTDFKSGIGGTGAVTQAGSGTLIFVGTNTYTGATTVSAGTLLVTGSTHASSAVTVASGATLGGTGTVNGTVAVSAGGTLAPGTGGTTNGNLSTGAVSFSSTGVLSVDLVNATPANEKITTTGTFTCTNGTLTVASTTSPAAGTVYTIVSATAVSGTFSGKSNGSTFASASGRTFQIVYTTTTVTLTDVTGVANSTKVWNGLGADNNWTTAANWTGGVAPIPGDALQFAGSTRVNPCVNDFGAATSFASITFAAGASTFTLTAGNSITLTGNITDSSSNNQNIAIPMILNVATSTMSTANNLRMSGIISETGGARAITKSGAGTLTMGINNVALSMSYSGGTTISAGTLLGSVQNNACFGAGTITISSGTTLWLDRVASANNIVNNGGTIVMDNGFGSSISGTITNNALLSVQVWYTTHTFSGNMSGTGGITLTQFSGGTLSLSGTNSYSGATTVSSGTLKAGSTSAFGTNSAVTLANTATAILDITGFSNSIGSLAGGGATGGNLTLGAATLTVGGDGTSTSYDGVISGTGAVTKAGAGAQILTRANTYTGATTVSAGTLQIGNGSTTGALSTSSAITNNATLTFNRTNTMTQGTDFRNVISGSGAIIQMGAGGTLVLNGSNTYTGTTSVQDGTLSITTILDISGGASAVGAPTSAANGTIALGSTTTTGTLVYTGTAQNTNRVINLAGTTGGGIIDQSGTGLLKFTSAFTATGVGAKTLTLQGSTAGTGEINAAMVNGSGTTALTKTGTGVWTLSGTNTYTGATTVSAGTLLVTGSTHASSAVAVNGTGTLGGTGTVNGTITMAAGGTIAPGLSGVSIGTLFAKTTIMHASSIYSVDLSGASSADLLSAAGQTVTCAGTLTVANNAGSALGNTYTIINAGTVTGTFSGLANNAVFVQGGRLYRIVYMSSSVTLTDVAPVISSRETMDVNGNGKLDHIRLTFDQNLNANYGSLTVTVAGYTVTGYAATGNAAELDVAINELGSADTGATPLVQIFSNASLRDAANTTLVQAENAPGTAATDKAKPVLLSALYSDGGSNGVSGGDGDTLVLTFSENVTSTSMVVADLTLPVSGDTLSTSTIANKSTATPTITVVLAGTPLLSPGNTYASSTLGAGKPSGIYLSTATHLSDQATVPNTGLIGTVAADAVDIGASPSSSISIEWNDTNDTVDKTWTLGPAALSTSYVSSTYTVHNIGYSTVALATTSSNSTSATTTWTVQPAVGANQFTMKADASTPLDAVYELTLSTSAITLAPFVRSGTTQDFKLQLSTPTTSATAATQAITVTITASQY